VTDAVYDFEQLLQTLPRRFLPGDGAEENGQLFDEFFARALLIILSRNDSVRSSLPSFPSVKPVEIRVNSCPFVVSVSLAVDNHLIYVYIHLYEW
jgi:hypothetical protein